jgi:predicted nuclease of predicted toxin-antitoxin system
MKFIADMGISPKSVVFLKDFGFEAFHLNDLGLRKLPDSEILAKARKENFIVLTHDLDFGDLLAASGDKLPSVITFRLRNMKAENVNSYLRTILSLYRTDLERGLIISVSERSIRVRELPISNK